MQQTLAKMLEPEKEKRLKRCMWDSDFLCVYFVHGMDGSDKCARFLLWSTFSEKFLRKVYPLGVPSHG